MVLMGPFQHKRHFSTLVFKQGTSNHLICSAESKIGHLCRTTVYDISEFQLQIIPLLKCSIQKTPLLSLYIPRHRRFQILKLSSQKHPFISYIFYRIFSGPGTNEAILGQKKTPPDYPKHNGRLRKLMNIANIVE